MERIGVYCSSSVKIDKKYFDAARQLGEWIGSNGKWLVYGGSNRGTMGTLAAAVKQSGGRVMGVVPTALEERDIVSDDLDVNFRCENLSDRKDIMIQESDILCPAASARSTRFSPPWRRARSTIMAKRPCSTISTASGIRLYNSLPILSRKALPTVRTAQCSAWQTPLTN